MSAPEPEREPVDELLRLAGRRTPPPDEVRTRTYQAVHTAWRKAHRQRVRLRHLSIAAALVLCVGIASLLWQPRDGMGNARPAARVASLSGTAELNMDSGAAPSSTALSEGEFLHNGDVVHSARGSQVVLRRASGLIIHVGPDSEVAWVTRNDLRLIRGLLYVDTQGLSANDPFAIVTYAGRIRHVGTRFSVAVVDGEVRVMVRDGLVSIGSTQGERRLPAGQQGRISAEGAYSSMPLASDAGPWNWLLGDSPRFAIEDRNLHEVLQELAGAAGIEVEFRSEADVLTARHLILHGPALAMPPRAAIDATLLTTQFMLQRSAGDAADPSRLEIVRR